MIPVLCCLLPAVPIEITRPDRLCDSLFTWLSYTDDSVLESKSTAKVTKRYFEKKEESKCDVTRKNEKISGIVTL